MNPQFGDETAIRLTLPAWDSWFSASTITTYTPRPPRQRNMDDPVCVFHTSGTTGNPKSICLRYSRCVVAAIQLHWMHVMVGPWPNVQAVCEWWAPIWPQTQQVREEQR
ncbi:putative AMP-dependent synthetase/ligase, AMP-binding, ANL domain-containing protein [Septoria linicola]|nr:putative AMP-dependent synthetase/ligase, AMP-binding, ANL domain-containing protein [Septoria linicola]